MQAAVLRAMGDPLRIEEVTLDDPAPDEVLVRTAATGICRTDRSMQMGAGQLDLPIILGHEAAGVVERMGAAVT